MPRTSSRLSHFTESVIRRMTRVANASGAINLSQGFPDFDPPPALLEAAEFLKLPTLTEVLKQNKQPAPHGSSEADSGR